MTRVKLPPRRPNVTVAVEHGGKTYAVTIGFYPDGRAGEVFARGAKAGSDMDAILDDACVAISLLLQHGADPAALAASMGRLGCGKRPASIAGALADCIAREGMHDRRSESRR